MADQAHIHGLGELNMLIELNFHHGSVLELCKRCIVVETQYLIVVFSHPHEFLASNLASECFTFLVKKNMNTCCSRSNFLG